MGALHIESGWADQTRKQSQKTRTDAYQFTAYPEDAGSMLKIEELRNVIKYVNKYSGKHGAKFRVSLKGRYGRKNPNYNSWRAKTGQCPLEHAQRIDVYIHRRYNYGY